MRYVKTCLCYWSFFLFYMYFVAVHLLIFLQLFRYCVFFLFFDRLLWIPLTTLELCYPRLNPFQDVDVAQCPVLSILSKITPKCILMFIFSWRGSSRNMSGATFSVTTGKEESQKESLSCVVILCTLSGTKEMPLEKVRAVATLAWKQHCLTSWHRCCSNTFPGKFIALPALNKIVKYLKMQ